MTMTAQRAEATSDHDADVSIVFPDGLVGCPDWKRFALLVDDEEEMPVAVLKSVDHPDVELLVTDPTLLDPEYMTHLGIEHGAVYCTLTVGEDGWITANLLGPLVIDPASRQGRQIVLTDSRYSSRHPVARAGEEA
jgi:flagellar assembly factor FliW